MTQLDQLQTEQANPRTADIDRLDSLAHALLEHETLDERDAYAAAGFDKPPSEPAKPPATVSVRDLQ